MADVCARGTCAPQGVIQHVSLTLLYSHRECSLNVYKSSAVCTWCNGNVTIFVSIVDACTRVFSWFWLEDAG